MQTQHHDTCRVAGRSTYHFIAIGALSIALCLANQASAALIGTNYYVRYDGQVRVNPNAGLEGHTNPSIPFGTDNIPPHEIPASTNPGAPLPNGRILTISESEIPGPAVMGMPTRHVILDFQGKLSAGGPNVFVNPLDATLVAPNFAVQFEARFYNSDPTKGLVLDLTKQVNAGGGVFHDMVELEDFGNFIKLPAAQRHVSGLGTQSDPLTIILDIPANIAPEGRTKFHFYFFEGGIPEPSTFGLMLIGIAAWGGSVAGRQRKI